MYNATIVSVTRTMFLSCFFCGMATQFSYAQTNFSSNETLTNRFFSPGGKFVKASNKDCWIWSSYPKDGESVTWSGAATNGKAQGTGIVQWFTNGVPTTSYEGEIKNGLSNGHGITRVSKDFPTFEGDWENGMLVSKTMTCHYETGGWYKGEQQDGFKDGQGEEFMVGGRYVGHFKHDLFDGKGEMFLKDGGKIAGEWAESKLVGVGTYTTSTGETIKVKMTDKGIERF